MRLAEFICSRLLAHPLTRGLEPDDPRVMDLRRQIVRSKPFYRKLLSEWYAEIAKAVPSGPGNILELGSGAGFMKEVMPAVITSEIFPCTGIDRVVDAERLPFSDGTLKAIVMTDVLHHIPDVRLFFAEATRCLRRGGVIAMVEPWMSAWSRPVYRHLHRESCDPAAASWVFPAGNPLLSANNALPWMVFDRDRELFEREFTGLRIENIRPIMPFRFLLSGGVSMRSLAPGWAFGLCRCMECLLQPIMQRVAMFAVIVLVRNGNQGVPHQGRGDDVRALP